MQPKYFAEFPGVGDRSVMILDGREARHQHMQAASAHARKYGYPSYRLAHGTFTTPRYLSPIIPVN